MPDLLSNKYKNRNIYTLELLLVILEGDIYVSFESLVLFPMGFNLVGKNQLLICMFVVELADEFFHYFLPSVS